MRTVDKALLPELREGMKDAADIVVADIVSKVPSNTGRARASVRSVSSGNTIYVKAGGARVPYFGWLDFGGKLPDKRPRNAKALSWAGASHPSARAEGATRAKLGDGRYVYPAIRRKTPQVIEAAALAFDQAAQRAGLQSRKA